MRTARLLPALHCIRPHLLALIEDSEIPSDSQKATAAFLSHNREISQNAPPDWITFSRVVGEESSSGASTLAGGGNVLVSEFRVCPAHIPVLYLVRGYTAVIERMVGGSLNHSIVG